MKLISVREIEKAPKLLEVALMPIVAPNLTRSDNNSSTVIIADFRPKINIIT